MPTETTEQINAFLAAFGLSLSSFMRLGAAILIALLSLLIARLARRGVALASQRRTASPQVTLLLTRVVFWTVIVLGLTIALQEINIDLTAVVAGLGIAGFTLGFALQDISKNFVSGVLLVMGDAFKVGDLIEVTGFTGKVLAIDLRATSLRTLDGRWVIIPNADVFTNPITNHSRAASRRVEFSLAFPYGSDLLLARQAVLQAVQDTPGLIRDPQPQVVLQDLGSQAVQVSAYFWIDTSQTDVMAAKDFALAAAETALQGAQLDLSPRQLVTLVNA